MILPNADSVFEQIEVFRKNIASTAGQSETRQEPEQKTNNIGIIGCRGAGKTSVLKTFKEMLSKQETCKDTNENRDILLPLIVPENMSSGTTLMDVILGMLKNQVDERKRNDEQGKGDCIYRGRNPLEKEYNELVKQYCYIKKDYRDILIRQFTTEQNYVDKTKEVFNSDTEFISLFREFVEHLLRGDDRENDALLFLFIDDIDLSTTKCMDVVRTLLSYLSHPRIVTFISGDMETFEEALTLDFLRQENALKEAVFQETYYSTTESGDDSNLLERKKLLAYEYLKKIIPPAYRKRIKYWSLEERGDYPVKADIEKKQRNLTELLIEVTKGKVDKCYFSYEENGELKYLSPVFHMFDETSRSLNNVYNVLQELYEGNEAEMQALKEPENSEEFRKLNRQLGIWRLIETIVDSKPLYSKHKEQLLKKIIVLWQDQVKIDFENANHLLYSAQEVSADDSSKDSSKDSAKFSSEDKFVLFVLVDFASQLFAAKGRQEKIYVDLKNKIIGDYLRNETIDGKIASPREKIDLNEEKFTGNTTYYRGSLAKMILSNLLYYGDFIFDLYIIKYLERDEIYRIISKKDKERDSEQADIYKVAFAMARALGSICETADKRKEYLADLYNQMPQTMRVLLNNISSDPRIIYGERLVPVPSWSLSKLQYNSESPQDETYSWNLAKRNLESIDYYIKKAKDMKQGGDYLYAEYANKCFLYWIIYEKKIKEGSGDQDDLKEMSWKLLHAGLKSATMRQLEPVMNQYEVKGLTEGNYSFKDIDNTEQGKKEVKKRQAIMLIDKDKMWRDPYARENVGRYLRDEINKYVSIMASGRQIFDASDLMRNSYEQLKNCYKGSSGAARIYELWNKINRLLELEYIGKAANGKYYMVLDQVLVMQCLLKEFLDNHYRIRYGKKEARQFLAELKALPLEIYKEDWEELSEEVQARAKDSLENLENYLREEAMRQLGVEYFNKDIIEKIRYEYYDSGNVSHSTLENIVRSAFSDGEDKIEADICYYIMYLVQKKQIATIKEKYCQVNRSEISWSNIEKIIPEQDYNFIFHSYLRYLQANESDAAMAGAEAEAVAKLAIELLDSEIIADTRSVGNIYETIGKKLELTEDEFVELFEGK